MSRQEAADRAARTLRRIARALDVPAERLCEPIGWEEGTDVEQAAELLRLFLRVDDLQARRRCIAFVRHAARAGVEDADPPAAR